MCGVTKAHSFGALEDMAAWDFCVHVSASTLAGFFGSFGGLERASFFIAERTRETRGKRVQVESIRVAWYDVCGVSGGLVAVSAEFWATRHLVLVPDSS